MYRVNASESLYEQFQFIYDHFNANLFGGVLLSAFSPSELEVQRVATYLKIVGKKATVPVFMSLLSTPRFWMAFRLLHSVKLSSTSNVKSYRLHKEQLVERATMTRSGQKRWSLLV